MFSFVVTGTRGGRRGGGRGHTGAARGGGLRSPRVGTCPPPGTAAPRMGHRHNAPLLLQYGHREQEPHVARVWKLSARRPSCRGPQRRGDAVTERRGRIARGARGGPIPRPAEPLVIPLRSAASSWSWFQESCHIHWESGVLMRPPPPQLGPALGALERGQAADGRTDGSVGPGAE